MLRSEGQALYARPGILSALLGAVLGAVLECGAYSTTTGKPCGKTRARASRQGKPRHVHHGKENQGRASRQGKPKHVHRGILRECVWYYMECFRVANLIMTVVTMIKLAYGAINKVVIGLV